MAKTLDEKNLMEKYKYSGVANQFLQANDFASTRKSLEKLAMDIGVPVDAKPLMRGTLEDPRYMKEAIDDIQEDYKKALDSITIGEYLKEGGMNLESLKENFGEFFGNKYGTIKEKIDRAKYVIAGIKEKKYKFPEGELEKKKNDLEKYGAVYLLIEAMEGAKFEALRGEVAGENYEESVDEISKDPKKYVKAAFAEYLRD